MRSIQVNMIDRHNIRSGQMYVRADGSSSMLLVIDTATHYECEDVIAVEINVESVQSGIHRIDAFKLAMCRYKLYGAVPDWALAPLAAKLLA